MRKKIKNLIILGTNAHAIEMSHIVARANAHQETWKLLGYIAPDSETETDSYNYSHPVLGTIDVLSKYPDAAIVPAYGFPRELSLPRERLVNLVDPAAFIHPNAAIGKGCVFYPGCFVGYGSSIGDLVFVLGQASINHHDRVGNRCAFATGATLAGQVTVEEDCYLGQSCSIRQNLRIGRNSTIGMGAVVINDVAPNSIMAGNPAHLLKTKEIKS